MHAAWEWLNSPQPALVYDINLERRHSVRKIEGERREDAAPVGITAPAALTHAESSLSDGAECQPASARETSKA